jgi:glycosyltransferase involved in cell wall biosynthesis
VVLLLVGSGEEQSRIEALVHALGLGDHVRFLGHRADVADLMAIADLFVLPSLFEGLPLAVLEAMSLGVLCRTRLAGIPLGGDRRSAF